MASPRNQADAGCIKENDPQNTKSSANNTASSGNSSDSYVSFNNTNNKINVTNKYYNIQITKNANACNTNYNNQNNKNLNNDQIIFKNHKNMSTKTNAEAKEARDSNKCTEECLRASLLKDLQRHHFHIPQDIILQHCHCRNTFYQQQHYSTFNQPPYACSSHQRPMNPSHQNSKATTSKVFGVELSLLPCALYDGLLIPRVLQEMLVALCRRSGHKGLFRLSGSKLRLRALQEAIECTGSVPLDCRVVDLACVFKKFFRLLPTPLLTSSLLSLLVSIHSSQHHSERRVRFLLQTCFLLPPTNLSCLKALFGFLKSVADQQDSNHMTATSLIVCFLPSLTNVENPVIDSRFFKAETEVLVILMNNHQHLGNTHLFPHLLPRSHILLDDQQEDRRKNDFLKNKTVPKVSGGVANNTTNVISTDEKENTFTNTYHCNTSQCNKTYNNKQHNSSIFRRKQLSSLFKRVTNRNTKYEKIDDTHDNNVNNNNNNNNDNKNNDKSNNVNNNINTTFNSTTFNDTTANSTWMFKNTCNHFMNKSVNFNIDNNNNNNCFNILNNNNNNSLNILNNNNNSFSLLNNNKNNNIFNYTTTTGNSSKKRKIGLFNTTQTQSKKMKFLDLFSSQRRQQRKEANLSTATNQSITNNNQSITNNNQSITNNHSLFHGKTKESAFKKFFKRIKKKTKKGAPKNDSCVDKQDDNTNYYNSNNDITSSITDTTNQFNATTSVKDIYNDTSDIIDKYTFNYSHSNNHNYSFDFIRKNRSVLRSKKYKNNFNQSGHNPGQLTHHNQNVNCSCEYSSNDDRNNKNNKSKRKRSSRRSNDVTQRHHNPHHSLVRKLDFTHHHSMDELDGYEDDEYHHSHDVINNYFSDDNNYYSNVMRFGSTATAAAANDDDDNADYCDDDDDDRNNDWCGRHSNIPDIKEEEEEEEEEERAENILDKGMIMPEEELPVLDEEYYDDTDDEDEMLKEGSSTRHNDDLRHDEEHLGGNDTYDIHDDHAFEVSDLSIKLAQGRYCKARNVEVLVPAHKDDSHMFNKTTDLLNERFIGTSGEYNTNDVEESQTEERGVVEDGVLSGKDEEDMKEALHVAVNRASMQTNNHEAFKSLQSPAVEKKKKTSLHKAPFLSSVPSSTATSNAISNSLDSGLEILDMPPGMTHSPSESSSSSSSPF